ncbi:MAG: TatD family hydrolase [Clostridia bacterium]|nr:TatD family hydrolase [Clostridia bacterium]
MELQRIFDTHAHYDDPAFDEDRDVLLSEQLPQGGVTRVVNCAVDLVSSARNLELAHQYDILYCALGYHPEQAADERKGDLDVIAGFLQSEDKAVAVGEIGLDYYWEENAPRETQMDLFARQLALANDLGLPVIIHDREAHGDTMDLLRKYRPQGVLHCFSGSVEMMKEAVQLGLYIGLGGVVTFKNARKAVEVAAEVPPDRLLLETDAPYMAPVPFRGKRNDSRYISYVAERIAEIRGMDPQELVDRTAENGCRLFSL